MTAPAGTTLRVYADEFEFFTSYLAPLFERPQRVNRVWCEQWYEHVMAHTTVRVLWETWEVFQTVPDTGLATWLRDFAHPLMGPLMDPDGTFSKCMTGTAKGHDPHGVVPLPHRPASQ